MAESKPTKVYTVDMSKVDEKLVDRYLVKLKLPDKGDAAGKVRRLVEKLKQMAAAGKIKKANLAKCDKCGGYSDIEYPECPYCGDTGVDEEAETALDKAGAGLVGVMENIEQDAASSQEEQKPEPAKPPKKKRSEVGKAAAGKKAKDKKPPKDKKKASKKKAAAKPAPEAKAEVVDEASGELAPMYTEVDLDRAVVEIAEAAVDTALGLYNYGQALAGVHSKELWKLRVDKAGEPRYKTFDHFCRDEVKISRQHAYRMMAVATNYTKAQLEQFGISKLHIGLEVPPELRSKLLGDGSESARDMSKRARELAGKEEAARHTPKVDKSKAVTVAIVPGIQELPMQKRPLKVPWPLGKLTEPATSLQDDPWFRLPLTNDVVLSVRLTRNDKGEIIAIVEHRRGKETS